MPYCQAAEAEAILSEEKLLIGRTLSISRPINLPPDAAIVDCWINPTPEYRVRMAAETLAWAKGENSKAEARAALIELLVDITPED